MCKQNIDVNLNSAKACTCIIPSFCLVSGCALTESKDIVQFLREVPAEDLWPALGEGFRPVVDGNVVQDWPHNLYANNLHNRVDYMLGCNSHEGAMFAFGVNALMPLDDKSAARQFAKQIIRTCFQHDTEAITDRVLEEYLPSPAPTKTDILKGLIDMQSDLYFNLALEQTASQHSSE